MIEIADGAVSRESADIANKVFGRREYSGSLFQSNHVEKSCRIYLSLYSLLLKNSLEFGVDVDGEVLDYRIISFGSPEAGKVRSSSSS